jgi:hypothetical protein
MVALSELATPSVTNDKSLKQKRFCQQNGFALSTLATLL